VKTWEAVFLRILLKMLVNTERGQHKRKSKKGINKNASNVNMKIEEVFGKRITNILVWSEMEVYGLDKAKVFLELDNETIIDIPFSFTEDVWIKTINKKVESLFTDLSDYPIYYVNKESKSIDEINEIRIKREQTVLGKIRKFLRLDQRVLKDYMIHKTEYKENKIKFIEGAKIVDFLFFEDSFDKGFFELENGYIITETTISNHGTGSVGLNYYSSLNDFEDENGIDSHRLTNTSNI
jgi:hypothetical protein